MEVSLAQGHLHPPSSRLAPLLTPRYLHSCSSIQLDPQGEVGDLTALSMATLQVGVMVAGGYSSTYLNSTEVYRPTRDRWEAGGDMAVPRQVAPPPLS